MLLRIPPLFPLLGERVRVRGNRSHLSNPSPKSKIKIQKSKTSPPLFPLLGERVRVRGNPRRLSNLSLKSKFKIQKSKIPSPDFRKPLITKGRVARFLERPKERSIRSRLSSPSLKSKIKIQKSKIPNLPRAVAPPANSFCHRC
jgi:hypothetical protein